MEKYDSTIDTIEHIEVGLNEGMLCNGCLTKIEKSSTRSKLAKVFMKAAFKDGGLNG